MPPSFGINVLTAGPYRHQLLDGLEAFSILARVPLLIPT